MPRRFAMNTMRLRLVCCAAVLALGAVGCEEDVTGGGNGGGGWVYFDPGGGTGGGGGGPAEPDPVDAYVGTWLQEEDYLAGNCATQYEGTTGSYLKITKVDATTAELQGCEDGASCEVLAPDPVTLVFGDGGGETTAWNFTYQPAPAFDCTYRQTNLFACAAGDDTCAWVFADGDRMLLLGALAITEESGTECAEALASLQETYGNTYPMDGCTLTETVMFRRE
jgi:hypothetical protein